MEIIPAINCGDASCVKRRLAVVRSLGSPWTHIDIADGTFAPVRTWNKPQELAATLRMSRSTTRIEAHLMVQKPEQYLTKWSKVAGRILVHVEVLENTETRRRIFRFAQDRIHEIGLALLPETPIKTVLPYINGIWSRMKFVQLLAVTPGFSGQKFQKRILKKIQGLKRYAPRLTIEVDGGITRETARAVKRAGANIAVSASYIFESVNPQAQYETLAKV